MSSRAINVAIFILEGRLQLWVHAHLYACTYLLNSFLNYTSRENVLIRYTYKH